MKLAYKALNTSGKMVTGTIESDDVLSAGTTLHQRGLYVTDLEEADALRIETAARKPRASLNVLGVKKTKQVAVFTRQLCVLVASGTQVVDALSALERQAGPGPWHDAIVGVRTRVEQGSSLSEALDAYPGYFDAIYRSLVSAGESSGHMVKMLTRLATLKQKQLKIRNAIRGAMVYPSLLITLSLVIFSILLIFIIPRFTMLFDSLDVPLPPTTQVLVTISLLFRRFWWLFYMAAAGSIIGAIFYLQSASGRVVWDRVVLRIPYFGQVAKNFATARIVRLLGVLLSGQVPVLNALELVQAGAGNVRYTELMARAQACVSRGEPVSTAFADMSLINPAVYEAMRSGEQSGQLDQLLLNVAEFLEDENDVVVRSLTSIIEPIILVGMGLLVGLIAVSMFLPLFDLTAMTQGGR